MPAFGNKTNNQLVGLSGTLNAGKDTAANHLVEYHGFMHVSCGDVLRIEAQRQGLGVDRATLIEVGVVLRREYGSVGALVLKGIEQWQEQRCRYQGGLVVSGLRVPGEAQQLKDQGGKLLFVDAPVEKRYKRMVARSRDSEAQKTIDEFVEHERIELEGLGGSGRPHLRAIEAISDVVLQNNDGVEAFINALDGALNFSQ